MVEVVSLNHVVLGIPLSLWLYWTLGFILLTYRRPIVVDISLGSFKIHLEIGQYDLGEKKK